MRLGRNLEAARIANVDSFVQHLDNGYDTVLTDDGAICLMDNDNWSPLRVQPFANAPVLILGWSDILYWLSYREDGARRDGPIMEGRTVFVIAHRLSNDR